MRQPWPRRMTRALGEPRDDSCRPQRIQNEDPSRPRVLDRFVDSALDPRQRPVHERLVVSKLLILVGALPWWVNCSWRIFGDLRCAEQRWERPYFLQTMRLLLGSSEAQAFLSKHRMYLLTQGMTSSRLWWKTTRMTAVVYWTFLWNMAFVWKRTTQTMHMY